MSSSSVEVLNVRLRRIDLSVPWGFNLQGGREFSSPLMITKVAQNSLADKSLVRPGDYILKIGNRSVENFTHNDARNAILEQGNDLELTLQRNAVPRREDYLIHYDFPQHKLMNPESLEPHSGIPTGSPQVGIQLKDNRALLTQSYNSPLSLYSKQNVASTLATTIKKPSDEESDNVINNDNNSDNKNNNNCSLNHIHISSLTKTPLNNLVNLNPTPKPFKSCFVNNNNNNNNINNDNNNEHETEFASSNKSDKIYVQKFETVTALPLKAFCENKVKQHSVNSTKENKDEYSKSNEITYNKEFNSNNISSRNINNLNKNQEKNSNSDKNTNKIGKYNYNNESVYNESLGSSVYEPVSKNLIQSRISEVLLKKQEKMEKSNPVGIASKNTETTTATTILTNKKFNDQRYYNKYLNIDEKNILSEQNILQNLALTEPPSSPFQSQSNPSSISNKPVSNNDFPQNLSHQNFARNNEPRVTSTYGGVNKNAQEPNFSSGPRNFNRGLKGSAILRAENSQAVVPQCYACGQIIRGPFISAVGKTWCPNHFVCANPSCGINLENVGFVEENGKLFCERDYHDYFAPKCVKCYKPIVGDTCYALQKAYHPDCFTCAHCNKKIGSTGFHVEDGQPYCLKDYNELFSSKCASCNFPIDAGDRFLEAMNQVFHADCFTCTTCNSKLENIGFVVKANKPYCKRHAMFT